MREVERAARIGSPRKSEAVYCTTYALNQCSSDSLDTPRSLPQHIPESTTFYTPCQGVMEGRWKNRLHFNLLGENVLVDGLHLDSAWSFFLASCLTVFICSSER